jgi:ribosomal protein L7/L12
MNHIKLEEKEVQRVIELIKQGSRIEAVVKVQALTQSGLKNSKDYVDFLAENIKKEKN